MTSKKHQNIYIIGAGISGLIVALELEKNGYHSTIIEASDSVGGRVKTDVYEGYQLDHGFQVLLTSYPAAQKYFNYEELELQKFLPGAVIYENNTSSILGDGFRCFDLLFSTLTTSKVTFGDKLKILKLNRILKNKTLQDIFSKEETTTLQYLKNFGFSQKAICNFFAPFFSGIFLETTLSTSSRMFEFVYKMFGTGYAALPKAGIAAIPNQLKNKLKSTTFLFNTKVASVEKGLIKLSNGDVLGSNMTIIATDSSSLLSNRKSTKQEWKSCQTLYFETKKRTITKPLIGLLANEFSLINNIFYTTSIANNNSSEKELLSVTVVRDHNLHETLLIKEVIRELKEFCGIDVLRFVKMYDIPKALPKLESLKYAPTKETIEVNDSIILAGDQLCNGSLNAAMLSGELAAKVALENLNS
ncbi:flavin-dependent amine oxidoreductase [Tenacibaculum skagerrakense]|uniref:Flavin-dependent amine oxidoreductase n=1 Tax=Tenacibaculum skagerrakense TaxID=186571 RepID=A0A4R2NT06_9FLAO|nr:FAD-dependent oxidoreductase [Tenacibaculum skagerrakense]TCP25093.1 flavin-dependent amine oxidoreductase [Tenacibaculum skagerrakense]